LGWSFLWTISDIGKSDPEAILATRGPQTPAIIFLHWIGKLYSQLWESREPLLQPRRKVLSEAARINEVWFDFPVLEEISLDDYWSREDPRDQRSGSPKKAQYP
jgi:hypothetical protein